MKIGFLMIILTLVSPFNSAAQINMWRPESSGTSLDLNSVSVINGAGMFSAFAAGDSGLLLKRPTVYAYPPLPWIPLNSPTFSNLFAIDFPTLRVGYAAGQAGVLLKTMDSGSSWTVRTIGTTNIFGLHFLNVDTGWAVGSMGDIFKTVNGGANWVRATTGTTNEKFEQIITSTVF